MTDYIDVLTQELTDAQARLSRARAQDKYIIRRQIRQIEADIVRIRRKQEKICEILRLSEK